MDSTVTPGKFLPSHTYSAFIILHNLVPKLELKMLQPWTWVQNHSVAKFSLLYIWVMTEGTFSPQWWFACGKKLWCCCKPVLYAVISLGELNVTYRTQFWLPACTANLMESIICNNIKKREREKKTSLRHTEWYPGVSYSHGRSCPFKHLFNIGKGSILIHTMFT